MSRFDPQVAELREAAKRPQSRFPLNWEIPNTLEILLPHLAALRQASHLLSVRATALVAAGRSEEALADLRLALRLSGTVREEPVIISQLVRLATLQSAPVSHASPIFSSTR